ncbi:secreted and transmembrane protein 1 [Pteropus medius]|uniref:secreted and transmembrane protein 1 n=1 Tax=Pteropus vampyrus TaxID=132908 RepID=UPI00196A75D7|nr:secreted and transmembrane protein 1 [Pteropus giganteus]XP_039715397.1 secreted and transmembrane protein 1 [Pteropus giganteus]XP_039715398.1 secreted and transmembrane protein 1 [Pteropus giganteus]XP_039715399.1 secreted and transmembrane protein 1 [Pteropus giganteus]
MRTSTPFLPTPLTLWALLLIAVSPSAQTGKWDDPACTKDVVSVSRGQPAVMTCNISNPFSFVNICMMGSGDCQPIFQDVTQGDFVQDRWKLCIRGGVARLETEEAQDTQAGRYKWLLVGGQKSIVFTTLNVSEPPEPPLTLSSWALGTLHDPLEAQTHSQPQGQFQSQLQVTLVLVLTTLFILGVLVWRRRCCSPQHQLVPQMSWFRAEKRVDTSQEREEAHLVSRTPPGSPPQ